MKAITLLQPQKIVFGTGCLQTFCDDYLKLGLSRLFVLTAPPIVPLIEPALDTLRKAGITISVHDDIQAEPTVSQCDELVSLSYRFEADSVVGIGGGSVLDLAKLVATFSRNTWQTPASCFGTGLVDRRGLWFACLPTTAGTGSEVTNIAVMSRTRLGTKLGLVSPAMVITKAAS